MSIDIEKVGWFNRTMTVFHLKYRPQKLADLDLESVSKTLKKILESKEVPQSFLFAGPKGAGKTSAARIFTKALNCLNPDGVEPCGKCENCAEINNGTSIDVIEMDAASNRGIEDVRSLKDKAILMPSKLKYKVFIIDEVHMLTKEAFNAMLKLIEEPPKHTVFIMCTTDTEKIPETIMSRLIKVDFTKGGKEELKKSLKRTIIGEGIEIDEETIEIILQKNDGSFRNLQKTFNEMFLNVGKVIKKIDVENFFAAKTGDYAFDELENDLSKKDIKIILEKLEKMAKSGVDFVVFREKLMEYFQEKLLLCFGIGSGKAGILNQNEIEKIINLLIGASKQEKGITIDQLPIELAVIEYCRGQNPPSLRDTSVDQPASNLGVVNREAENYVKQNHPVVKTESVLKDNKESSEIVDNQNSSVSINIETSHEVILEQTLRPSDTSLDREAINSKEMDVEVKEVEIMATDKKIEVTECVITDDSVECVTCTAEDVEKAWGQILANIKPINHSVEAFLRASRPKAIDKNVLIVEVFYPFHKDRLEEAKNRKIVEFGLTQVLKTNLAFECVLSKDKKAPLIIRNDTPMEKVSEQLAKEEAGTQSNSAPNDIYDVAKEIFG